jgi:hypothetical protein
VPNPCARPNQQQFTSRLDRKSTCVDADNNRFGRRGNGASRISALFPAAAAKILSPPVVFFAEVEKHATRSLAQMQRKATLSACETSNCHAANDRFGSVPFSRTRTTASGKACCTAARYVVSRSCRRRERRCTSIGQLGPRCSRPDTIRSMAA